MTDDRRGPDDEGLESLLRTLDHDLPRVAVRTVIARARRPRVRRARIAAAVAGILVMGGVAYALPGSPVRPWLDAAMERLVGGGSARTPGSTGAPDPGGIAFDPAAPLAVVFTPPLLGYVRITLADGGELVARSAPGSARFTSDPRRLRVAMLASDTFDLRIPRGARRVEVVAGERRLFLIENGQVSAAAPPAGPYGYLFPLGPSSP